MPPVLLCLGKAANCISPPPIVREKATQTKGLGPGTLDTRNRDTVQWSQGGQVKGSSARAGCRASLRLRYTVSFNSSPWSDGFKVIRGLGRGFRGSIQRPRRMEVPVRAEDLEGRQIECGSGAAGPEGARRA